MTKVLHKIWHEFLKALFWMRIAVCFPAIVRELKRLSDEGAKREVKKEGYDCDIKNERGIGFKY